MAFPMAIRRIGEGLRLLRVPYGTDPGSRAWSESLVGAAAGLCLAVAGCAALGTMGSEDRHAVIDRIVAASAQVLVENGGRRAGSGSGVVVASRREGLEREEVSYVLTVAHLLEDKDGTAVFVRFGGPSGARGKLAATVRRRGNADSLDLALLRVPGIGVVPASFAEEAQVRLGEEVLVAGFPWGKRLGLFGGIVSQVPAETKDEAAGEAGMMVDAAVTNGVSGGGVFDVATGSLLGVVEGYQTASIAVKGRSQTYSVKVPMPGETYVVPIARVRRFLVDAGLDEASRWQEQLGGKAE